MRNFTPPTPTFVFGHNKNSLQTLVGLNIFEIPQYYSSSLWTDFYVLLGTRVFFTALRRNFGFRGTM